MLELDKQKWRDCLMKISRLKIKRLMLQDNMSWSAIDE